MKEQILSQLNLEEGYYISNIEADDNCFYVDIDYQLNKVPCPTCKSNSKIHDRLSKTWRHTDYQDSKVYIRFKNPRALCDQHGVKITDVNWAKPKHRFTILLEELVYQLAENKSFLQIARELDEHDTRIRRVVKRRQDEKSN